MTDTVRVAGDGDRYVGKRLVVGITWQTEQGEILQRQAFHGRITYAADDRVIVERAGDGMRVSLPPELQPAPPGRYRLPDEVVEDPDYLAKWVFDGRLWGQVMIDDTDGPPFR